MKNNYEAPEVFSLSTIDSFVLGSKPWAVIDLDAIFGWGYGMFFWLDDLDEGQD